MYLDRYMYELLRNNSQHFPDIAMERSRAKYGRQDMAPEIMTIFKYVNIF